MTQTRIAFLLFIPDGGYVNHECFVCEVPRKGDVVFISGIIGKPYTDAIAQRADAKRIAKIKEIALVVNVEETTTFYTAELQLVKTMPLNVPYEVIRKM